MTSGPVRDDARALRFVQRFGRTGTAFQVLSRSLSHWFDGTDGVADETQSGADSADGPDARDRGMVAYFDTGRAWVAAGEPLAAPGDAIAVAEHFVVAARAAGKRPSFFATEGVLASSPQFSRFPLGEQPVWNPQQWVHHLQGHRSLREQLRRARAKGVVVRQLPLDAFVREPALRSQLDAVVQHWLAALPMPPMHFMVEVDPLMMFEQRRLFIAELQGQVVGLLSLAPVPQRSGWLFEHLLRDPFAPNGTSELLVDSAMRAIAADGVTWATLGLAPLAGDIPLGLKVIRTVTRPLFNFDGLAAFKRKLGPQHWEPIYLALPAEAIGLVALLDGLRAFAGRPLWKFALHTALRGPRPLLRALENLLIPWTLLLAFAPTGTWFPNPWIHAAWVVFDVLLYALLSLVRRRTWLLGATVAAAAVTLDAVLTLWQALAWNASRISTWEGAALAVIACAGPLIMTPILWGAVRRLRRMR